MGCRPVSSRLIIIRLRAVPFNITVVQVYSPTSGYDDNEIEEFCDQLQNVIDQTPKKRLSCYTRRLERKKWTRMLMETGKAFVDSPAKTTQMTGDLYFWSLPPLTILCRRTLLVITKHPEDGPGIAQIDNTTARFITLRSRVNIARTRSFPGADIGSDHDC